MTETPWKPLTAQEHYLAVYGRPITGAAKRRKPNRTTRQRILDRQGNQCLYCELPIGAKVARRGKTVTLRLNWDHFIPHAYAASNGNDNWVIACHVCNGIKSAQIFDTVMEAQLYIRPRWDQLGYERAAVAAVDPGQPTQTVPATPGPTPDLMVLAVRIVERLRDNRRILPRGRLMAMYGNSDAAERALAYLVANGNVTEQAIDGKTICTLRRQLPREAMRPNPASHSEPERKADQ